MSKISSSVIRRFLPDLIRKGTPPNRQWHCQYMTFDSLQEVVDHFAPAHPELYEFSNPPTPSTITIIVKRKNGIFYVSAIKNSGEPVLEKTFAQQDQIKEGMIAPDALKAYFNAYPNSFILRSTATQNEVDAAVANFQRGGTP